MEHTDPASPFALNVRDVGRRPGSMSEVRRTVEPPPDFRTDVLAVRPEDPMDLDLRLESVHEGILVTGTVTATATGACVRCLDEVDLPVDSSFQELYVWPDRAAHHREVATQQDDDEELRIEDDMVDLDPVLRDAVLAALPFQPVCREDCPGLCSQCGFRLEDDPDHQHDVIDPRWAALEALQPLATEGEDDEEKRT
ncbi:DUF177 domain-containing protein [Marihabitans asiaticum]|uniref:Metal-binding protein n=1 Tax=Marihabitans asiaticum TaxID=415218 RepID=A0A560W9K1_9MICO|nr:DUF177 domain-containing protein [Marihabitans asiaticum]TWD14304.1 uncharacterized protein FB557_1712 [Marihabitans asiaticum]